jgi:autotransporter-associated beta strand protein
LNGAGTVTNSSTANAVVSIGSGLFTGLIDNGAGSMGLTKVGPGTLELTAPNTYNGGSSVQGGTLQINAAQNGGGPVSVAGGATLAIRYATPTTFNSSTFTLGSGTGGTLSIDLGTLPNPAIPVVAAPAFTVNGTNTIVLSGSGLTTGTFKLIDYTGSIGGAGFNGLTFTTPIPRIIASLVNNTTDQSVDLTISGLDKPKWTGAINTAWNIDDGTGTGTANWKEVASSNVTRYRETASGNDSVLFDDTAPVNATTVNLTTTLSPSGVAVNTSSRTYTFTGVGKLTGAGGLLKQGSAEFYLANTGGNDYSGTTTISGGSLLLGNGGAGEGQLGTGPLVNNASFILNRPDDFVIPNNISGSGLMTKRGAGVATLTGTVTLSGTTTIQAGAIQLSGFADLPGGVVNNSMLLLAGPTPMSGVIAGNGIVTAQGAGAKQIGGTAANTYTGGTSITEGSLQLNKTPGVAAVGGDVVIEGTGQLQLLAPDQIPDTATITYNSAGTSTVLANETIANVTIIGGSEASQLQANNGLVISNLLSMSTGVFSVASNHSASIAGINISGGTLRIAANTNPSTMNVGAGGITATGGLIQVGQGTGNFDAVLNLEGNYTGSGFVEFARGNYSGPNRREINLGDSTRTFNVISEFTTVRPDITGNGGLIKAGDGTLSLTGTNTFTGDTTIQAGTLSLSGALSGSASIDVKSGATFDVTAIVPYTLSATQTLKGTGTIAGNLTAAGKLSPGESIGTLNFVGDLMLAGTADFEINKSGLTLTADRAAISGLLTYGGALNVAASGNSLSAGDSFDLFDASSFTGQFTSFNLPALGPGLTWNTTRLPIDGTLFVVIPEPQVVTLLVSALLGMSARRRRN